MRAFFVINENTKQTFFSTWFSNLYVKLDSPCAEGEQKVRIVFCAFGIGQRCSGNEDTARIYEQQLHAMIAAWRKDLGNEKTPVVVGELGQFFKKARHKDTVDAALKALPKKVKRTAWVTSTGLGHKGDVVHFSAAAYREFGKRYANKIKTLQN